MFLNINQKTKKHSIMNIIFIIITGLFFHSTSAVKVQYLTLFKPKMTLQLGTRNIIPCSFYTKRLLNPLKVELEWGKIPVGQDKYVPLIRLRENQVTMPSPDLLDMYDLFVSEISRGNCSLVIRHTKPEDSGTYMVRLKVKGKLIQPVPSIKIRVMNLQTSNSQATISQNRGNNARNLIKKKEEPEATTPPITTTLPTTVTWIEGSDFIDWYILPKLEGNETVALIVVLVVGSILTAFSVLGVVAWVLYFKLRKKVPLGDVENPVETTPIASSNGNNKESEKSGEEEDVEEEEVEEEEVEEEEFEEEEVEEEEAEEEEAEEEEAEEEESSE